MRLGNMCLGVVTHLGKQVTGLRVGDRVFGHLPARATHTQDARKLQLVPKGISPQALMYTDPAEVALGGVRDVPVRLGDRVAVFGLGAIGQMAVQAAKLAGARWVVAVDPIEIRRDAAARHGADLIIDPAQDDAGLVIKQQTGSLGVDVSLETSGSYAALNDALRATKYRGTVLSTAYYTGPSQGLTLAGEWHRNRIQLISSRANSEPQPEHGWDFGRIQDAALELLTDGRLQADDLMHPVVALSQAAEAYRDMNEHPERGIKLGIDHTLEG
jgi:threonine dehydrogenase-like Zn-dependent dehydrogenase